MPWTRLGVAAASLLAVAAIGLNMSDIVEDWWSSANPVANSKHFEVVCAFQLELHDIYGPVYLYDFLGFNTLGGIEPEDLLGVILAKADEKDINVINSCIDQIKERGYMNSVEARNMARLQGEADLDDQDRQASLWPSYYIRKRWRYVQTRILSILFEKPLTPLPLPPVCRSEHYLSARRKALFLGSMINFESTYRKSYEILFGNLKGLDQLNTAAVRAADRSVRKRCAAFKDKGGKSQS